MVDRLMRVLGASPHVDLAPSHAVALAVELVEAATIETTELLRRMARTAPMGGGPYGDGYCAALTEVAERLGRGDF